MKRRLIIGIMLLPLLCGLILGINIGLATDGLPVHNIDTGLNYATIQEAIDASETQDGHTIEVDAGIYYEHVTITKSLYLIGENRDTTIIDGSEAGTVVKIMADNVVLSNFTIQNSGVAEPWTPHAEFMNHGVEVYGYNNVTISNNIIRNNEVGIYEKFSHNSSIVGNLVTSNKEVGIAVHHSKNNFLRDNNMTENAYHLSVWGASNLDEYIHNIDTSNTVNGKPVYYWVNEADKQVPLDAGHVSLINSTNIKMENVSLRGSNLWLVYTTNSIIKNVSITDVGLGVIVHSSYNTITENLVYTTIAKYVYLAHFENSFDNRILHNNFIHTKTPWKITNLNSVNTWDNGSEGNYWSDYTGEDLNGDGIGDTLLPHHGIDWYPLMKPWMSVEIDQTYVSDERVDIGRSQTIGFHAKWVNNSSDVVDASIFVNGTEYVSNGTGWIFFNYTTSSVGKKTWIVTSVNANGVTSYRKTAENPSIIWDRVIVTLENNRVNVGNEPIISAFYKYDGEAFSGSIMLNDTVFTQDILGKRAYKVIGIIDDKYQLTQFTPNEVYVIFDRIKASYHIETLSPGTFKVIVNVQYEYDNAPVVDATVKVNDVNGENLGNGIYEVNLPLWIPYQSINIEIEKIAFTPMKYNITVYSLGNVALWAFMSFSTISAMVFSRAKWIHKRKLRRLRDLIENRKIMSIEEVAKMMNVKTADAEKLLHELMERRMVEGFFTSDGKAFITEEKLKEEILRSYDEKD